MSVERSMIGVLCSSALVVAAVATGASASVTGPDWDESGDAGALPASAQNVTGFGLLDTIHGRLEQTFFGGDFEDMYAITISAPLTIDFSAGMGPPFGGSADFDAQLWLFDSSGLGLLGNDSFTIGAGAGFFDMSTDGTGVVITAPGLYYIAVSGAGNAPVSAGGEIFAFAAPSEVSGPDGPGGSTPITGWTGLGDQGEYTIKFTGARFVPGPSTVALLVFGACMRGRRRRS